MCVSLVLLCLSWGCMLSFLLSVFFFQAEDGIRDLVRSRGLGDVYKRQGRVRRFLDFQTSQDRPLSFHTSHNHFPFADRFHFIPPDLLSIDQAGNGKENSKFPPGWLRSLNDSAKCRPALVDRG